jgi:hypothetical protein
VKCLLHLFSGIGGMFIWRILLVSLANLLCILSSDLISANQIIPPEQDTHTADNGGLLIPQVSQRSYTNGAKHKHPGYTSGPHYLDTLSWVVKIKPQQSFMLFHSSRDQQELANHADNVAEGIGLTSDGQVGHFPDIFMFTHPHQHLVQMHPDYHHVNDNKVSTDGINAASKSPIPHVIKLEKVLNYADSILNLTRSRTVDGDNWDRLFDVNTWDGIIQQVQNQLDGDESVEWYTRQSVRRRTKRSVQFNDPQYFLQWHLVSMIASFLFLSKVKISFNIFTV